MSLIFRGDKGSKLTIEELDNNFKYLSDNSGGTTVSKLEFEVFNVDALTDNNTDYNLPLTITDLLNCKGIIHTSSQTIDGEEGGFTFSFRYDLSS